MRYMKSKLESKVDAVSVLATDYHESCKLNTSLIFNSISISASATLISRIVCEAENV